MAGNRSAFFYGTLMAPEVLYRVIYGQSTISSLHPSFKASTLLTLTPAILDDYCRYKVQGADYPGIVFSAGHSVRGTFVTGLTDSDIHRLDGFEGSDYTREKVTVSLLDKGGNEPVGEKKMEAETYVFKHRDELEDSEWDYDTFRKEKMHRWADHSEEYAEVDKLVEEEDGGHDPTGGRGIYSATTTTNEKDVLKNAV